MSWMKRIKPLFGTSADVAELQKLVTKLQAENRTLRAKVAELKAEISTIYNAQNG